MPLTMASLQELPAHAFLDLVSNSYTRVTFSQLGEDIVVNHLLQYHLEPVKKGFYVDIGAYHPRHNSNTFFLHLLGWSGVNVEPSRDSIEAFRLLRPNDVNLHLGVGVRDAEMTYYKFANPDANTFSAERAEKWKSQGYNFLGTETIRVRPINEVLSASVPPAQAIAVMNLDIVGFEREVIREMDLRRFRPKILIIEIHDVGLNRLSDDETVAYLLSQDYRVAAAMLTSVILIDRRVAKNFD